MSERVCLVSSSGTASENSKPSSHLMSMLHVTARALISTVQDVWTTKSP